MKKASFGGLTLFLLISILILPAQASPNMYSESTIIHTEVDDFEIEVTTTIYDSISRSNSIRADKTFTAKQNGKVLAEVTLSAAFGYDGKTSWVTSASGSHTTYDGWSYSNENITKSGGTATLTATLTHLLHKNVPVNISLTCSPTGQIS